MLHLYLSLENGFGAKLSVIRSMFFCAGFLNSFPSTFPSKVQSIHTDKVQTAGVHWETRMFGSCLNISARGPVSRRVEKLSNSSPLPWQINFLLSLEGSMLGCMKIEICGFDPFTCMLL